MIERLLPTCWECGGNDAVAADAAFAAVMDSLRCLASQNRDFAASISVFRYCRGLAGLSDAIAPRS